MSKFITYNTLAITLDVSIRLKSSSGLDRNY